MVCICLACRSTKHHVRDIRWEKEMGSSQGSPGLLSGLRHTAGGQPGERRSRAVHQIAAGSHRGKLLWAEASPGRQRPDMDGAVSGAEWAGSTPGSPGPALGARVLPHRGCLIAAHMCQLRPSGNELISRNPLHHRKRGVHSQAFSRSVQQAFSCLHVTFASLRTHST